MLSVPLSTSDLSLFLIWQSGENLPGVVRWGLHVAVPRFLVLFEELLLLPCFSLSFVVLPTRCQLDVSRLTGLTLRPSAPVCCCHRDSLTGGRLAFAQEAVRDSPSLFSSIGSARDGMCPLISGSRREMSLQALMKFESPAIA